MRPTTVRQFRTTATRGWGWVNRENRVPHYQRLFQKHDGLRQWQKTPKSKWILRAYFTSIWGTFAGTVWMLGRLVLGHKTWIG